MDKKCTGRDYEAEDIEAYQVQIGEAKFYMDEEGKALVYECRGKQEIISVEHFFRNPRKYLNQ